MLLESAPILDCQATRDWLGSEPVMRGWTDSLVTMAGKARPATSELVGQEGDILTGSRLGGGSGGTGQTVQVHRPGGQG
jgi:hypothetical protein